jgi:antirestriction protein ArdC
VAEIGSAYLMASFGLSAQPRPDHAQYVESWLRLLKSQPKAIFTAASHASRAADYLHSLQNQPADVAVAA